MKCTGFALFCFLLYTLTSPALSSGGPPFDPPLSKGGLPANILVVKPNAALTIGEGIRAGSCSIWMAEKKGKKDHTAWKWQKAAPCAFKGGSRYRVAIIDRNRLSLKDITGTDPLAVGLNDISLVFENTLAVPMALIVTPIPDTAASPGPPASLKDLRGDAPVSGLYECELGKIRISRKGKTVAGSYDWSGGGTICGSLEGNVLTGTFADKYGSGEIRYTFDNTGFQNTWRFTGETLWREHPRAKKMK